MSLTQAERITRTKIQLYNKQPFFSYIVNHLIMHEVDKKEVQTMGVDAKGNCYYNNEFVSKLSDEELEGVLIHEAMHCALIHLSRLKKKDAKIWNYATDLVINTMLINNSFSLPKGCIIPTSPNEFLFNKTKVIKDLDKKFAEAIYNEMYDGADKINVKSFDIHIYDNDDNGNGSEGQSKETEDKWKGVITEATYFAKQRGNMPANMERIVDSIINKKLNWRQLLYRYITNEISHDFSYARPSRKFISTGIYFPSTMKENINIMVAIDTSGSISNKELSTFMGEIYKITRAHQNMTLEVIFHDTEISSKNKFNSMNLSKILSLKATGGGGTSHKEVFEYAKKQKPNILISFTDGYSDIDKCDKFNNTIFVLTADNKLPFGTSIYFDKSDVN